MAIESCYSNNFICRNKATLLVSTIKDLISFCKPNLYIDKCSLLADLKFIFKKKDI